MEWKEGRQKLTLDLNFRFFEIELKPLKGEVKKISTSPFWELGITGIRISFLGVFWWILCLVSKVGLQKAKKNQADFLVGEVSMPGFGWLIRNVGEHLFEKGS